MKYRDGDIKYFLWKWTARRYAKKARKAGYLAYLAPSCYAWMSITHKYRVRLKRLQWKNQ